MGAAGSPPAEATRERLAVDLRALGLCAGDLVVVHASLHAVGPIVGGADGLIDAFLDVLGPDGLLIVPTFTFNTKCFDPRIEPSATGALGERARVRAGAVRSCHPTHSVAAIGALASEFCAGHEEIAATDPGSPLDRLATRGGYVLLLGVGHVANTTVHVGEFRAGASYVELQPSLAWPRTHEIVLPDEVRTVTYSRFAGCSRAFGVVERGLRERALVHDGRVGKAEVQLMRGRDVVDETIASLRRDAGALLCTDPQPEHRCARARASMSTGTPRV